MVWLRLFLWTLVVASVVAAEAVWFAAPDVRRGDVASIERHLVERLRVVRVNPTTGDALILTVTGGSGAINRLGGDWIWWETGILPREARRELVYARLVPALIAIVAGAVAVVAWWRITNVTSTS
jgi:hypothetical protein